jgi:hypothetical protein
MSIMQYLLYEIVSYSLLGCLMQYSYTYIIYFLFIRSKFCMHNPEYKADAIPCTDLWLKPV